MENTSVKNMSETGTGLPTMVMLTPPSPPPRRNCKGKKRHALVSSLRHLKSVFENYYSRYTYYWPQYVGLKFTITQGFAPGGSHARVDP